MGCSGCGKRKLKFKNLVVAEIARKEEEAKNGKTEKKMSRQERIEIRKKRIARRQMRIKRRNAVIEKRANNSQ